LATFTGIALAGMAGPASAGVNSALNHPSYYESSGVTCTKVEYRDGLKYYAVPSGARFVVIKTGTMYTTLNYSESPMTFAKDISFVITCVGHDNT